MCLYTKCSIKYYGLQISVVDPIIPLLTFSFFCGLKEFFFFNKIFNGDIWSEVIRFCCENKYYLSDKHIINSTWFLCCLEDIADKYIYSRVSHGI